MRNTYACGFSFKQLPHESQKSSYGQSHCQDIYTVQAHSLIVDHHRGDDHHLCSFRNDNLHQSVDCSTTGP